MEQFEKPTICRFELPTSHIFPSATYVLIKACVLYVPDEVSLQVPLVRLLVAHAGVKSHTKPTLASAPHA